MAIKDELLDQLMEGLDRPEDLLGYKGLLQELKKALIEKALGAELTHHLGYERNDPAGRGSGNSRNGKSKKTVRDKDGQIEISVPRDRQGTFEPQLIQKGQTRIKGFDEKVISMYARGMTVREIQSRLKDIYAVDVSPDLISRVTSAVMEEVREWQTCPLDSVYPVVIFDALRIKIRDKGMVKNKAVYVALGIKVEGIKEVLGLWVEQTEGAKFWMRVMTELRNRGVADILTAVVDGLKGFPEAITSIYPGTQVQTCIVHMVRHSLKFVPWKERKEVADDLKAIYRAETEEAAGDRLADFKEKWGGKYPTIGQSWRRNREKIIPFLAYPPEARKLIYTTNAIEGLHRSLRKNVRNRGHFPNDDAAIKLLYLAIRNISAKGRMPQRGWKMVLNQFAILFEDRLQRAIWT